MPISTFFGLQTALRGLMANQRSLEVTGHNVDNASTPGFSRQEAVLGASTPLTVSGGVLANGAPAQLGSGVDVQSLRRIRDTFLDLQYRTQNTTLGEKSAAARSLEQAELALSEPGDNGLSAQLNALWKAWGDLSNAPSDTSARQALIDQAQTVAAQFATVDSQFATVGAQAQQEYAQITGTGGDVEGAVTEIASLNDAISKAVEIGSQPNDLLDRRDLLIDQLSALGTTTVTDLGGGMIQVDFGGQTLVNGATATTGPYTFTNPGGKLGALQQIFSPGGTIASYRDDLNAVAKTLADSINAIHGTTPPFFTYTAGSEASTLAVGVTTTTLKASAAGPPAPTGANDVAVAVSELAGGAADSSYIQLVTRIGSDMKNITREQDNAQTLVAAVDDRRQSVSGVSLDEEMTNLIRFQRGYQASARMMTTLDDVLDTLINRTGRSGL